MVTKGFYSSRIVALSSDSTQMKPTLPKVQNLQMDLREFAYLHRNRSVLITGAAGSIGSELARAVLFHDPKVLICLDSSESGLYDLSTSWTPRNERPPVAVLGSVCNPALLEEIFRDFEPAIVYHAAAFKHLTIAESNPFEVIHNNALGSHCIAQAALRYKAEQLLTISTDKAVHPTSILGVSKRIAELLMIALDSPKPMMKAVRLGNIWGSRGSVVPLFMRQIAAGGPLTVSAPDVKRYFMSMSSAIGVIFMSAAARQSGILVPDLKHQIPVLEVVESLIQQMGAQDVPIVFTGLQPGEKMSELLVSESENRNEINCFIAAVEGPAISNHEISRFIEALKDVLYRRSRADLLQLVLTLIPEYRPSELLKTNANIHDAAC